MKPDRPETTPILIDIAYKNSLNEFEEVFGENVSYKEMEQRSYIEFKETVFETINEDIKFRKFGRLGNVLTIKAEMLEKEIETFKNMLEQNEIKFSVGWEIKEITIIKNQEE